VNLKIGFKAVNWIGVPRLWKNVRGVWKL